MLVDMSPSYAKKGFPDIARAPIPDVLNCYDHNENPVFFYPILRVPTEVFPFTWNIVYIGSNFWDVIKNQVHIFPSLYVDFGLVLSQRQIQYYVWNSWSDKAVTIREPIAEGDYGTTFIFNTAGDFVLQSGQGTGGLLTCFIEGPISSATDFHIEVEVQDILDPVIYTLHTKATRIIIYPFWADWSDAVKFKMSFSTVMTKDMRNREQRRPLITKPQRSISFSQVDKIRGLISNAINFASGKTIGVPIVQEILQVSSISEGKTSITVRGNVDQYWNLNKYCDYICLIDTSTDVVVAKKIVTKTGNTITVENPVLEEFENLSSVYLFPMMIGFFKSAKPKVLNGNLIKWNLELEEMRGENQPALTNIPSFPTALSTLFDWEESVDFDQVIYRDIGEFIGTAQMIYQKYPYDINHPQTYSGTFRLRTRAEIAGFMDFVCGSKGRFRDFEYLWPLNGFEVIKGEFESTNQFRIRNNHFAEQFSKMINKKIRFRYRNHVLNTSIASVSSNAHFTTITLMNPTNFRVFDEDCGRVYIEQFKTVRFDLDEFTFDFISGIDAKVNIRFMEVYT